MGRAPTTKKLLEQVESWPTEDQEALVQYAREVEARRTGVYRLSDEEREAIDRSLEDVRQGRFASEERIAEIEALFAEPDFHRKHGQQTSGLLEEVASEKEKLSTLFARWEELEKIRDLATSSKG